jgi:hypothetical protein
VVVRCWPGFGSVVIRGLSSGGSWCWFNDGPTDNGDP